MTNHEWRTALLDRVAYVKSVRENGVTWYIICAADGTELAEHGNCEAAFRAIRNHELEPMRVH
jgi:hypothetical protein